MGVYCVFESGITSGQTHWMTPCVSNVSGRIVINQKRKTLKMLENMSTNRCAYGADLSLCKP
jgi:hypothetical protein